MIPALLSQSEYFTSSLTGVSLGSARPTVPRSECASRTRHSPLLCQTTSLDSSARTRANTRTGITTAGVARAVLARVYVMSYVAVSVRVCALELARAGGDSGHTLNISDPRVILRIEGS